MVLSKKRSGWTIAQSERGEDEGESGFHCFIEGLAAQ